MSYYFDGQVMNYRALKAALEMAFRQKNADNDFDEGVEADSHCMALDDLFICKTSTKVFWAQIFYAPLTMKMLESCRLKCEKQAWKYSECEMIPVVMTPAFKLTNADLVNSFGSKIQCYEYYFRRTDAGQSVEISRWNFEDHVDLLTQAQIYCRLDTCAQQSRQVLVAAPSATRVSCGRSQLKKSSITNALSRQELSDLIDIGLSLRS